MGIRVNDKGVREDIEERVKRLSDPGPLLKAIGEEILLHVDDSFEASESPSGRPWRPLSATTLKLNPRRAGGKILSATGHLRNSLNYKIQGNTVIVGTNVEYAATHQFGRPDNRLFKGPLAPIPARPFLPIGDLPDDLNEAVLTLIVNYVDDGDL